MSEDRYAYYNERLNYPTGQPMDDTLEPIDGWYRMRTKAAGKPHWPVVVWQDTAGQVWVQVGRAKAALYESEDWWRWRNYGWYHCDAVEEKEYLAALQTGAWPDGKAASNADPNTPKDEAGRPIDEDYGNNKAPTIEVLRQVIDELHTQAEALPAVINDEATAGKAGDIYRRLRQAWKQADTERSTEKEPHLTAGREVDARWNVLLTKATTAGTFTDVKLKDWLRREQMRINAEEAERKAAEKAAAEAEAARLAAEGTEPQPEPEPPHRETTAPKARVSSNFGQAVTLTKYKYGKITDRAAFIRSLKGREDFEEFLQKTADAAARAGVALKGMEIKEGTR